MGVVLAEVDFTHNKTIEELEAENRMLREIAERRLVRPKKPKIKEIEDVQYSPVKCNGVAKPTAAETIPDYDTFKKISGYLVSNPKWSDDIRARNFAMFWCGIGLGLRFSDIVRLQPKFIWDEDGNYRERLKITERKTQKFQQCLITEAVKQALDYYVHSTNGTCKTGKYLFPSRKGNGQTPMSTVQGWRIFNSVQKELNLPFHFSTHTMRHTCLNICLCVDDHVIDAMLLMKLQVMANHSSLTTTIGYLDSLWGITDQAREVVSDWMLGKTEKKDLKPR